MDFENITILVCGSRTYNNYKEFSNWLDALKINHIISGGAKGADALAERYAFENDINIQVHPADWDKHGKKAGYIRNRAMINIDPDIVIAFWDGKSRGTKDTIKLASEATIPLIIVYP